MPLTSRRLRTPQLGRSIPPSKGVPSDADLDRLSHVADAPADDAVAEYFETVGPARADLFQHLAAATADGVVDEDLPGIGPFLRRRDAWPTWADPEIVRDGQRVFGEFGPQLGLGLFMASLPSDYASKNGVQVLARTNQLTRQPQRRFIETGQLILDVMTPGRLDLGGVGYTSVRHVRLMHAAVRHVIANAEQISKQTGIEITPWDDSYGLPVNQLHLLGTLLSFSVEGTESLESVGVRLSAYHTEAYVHVWNLVGHLMGISDDLLPLSWGDSRILWDQRRQREQGPSTEGKALTAAAIGCMQGMLASNRLAGLPASGIRHYLGDATAEWLAVPPSNWTKTLFQVMRVVDRAYDVSLVRLPVMSPFAAILGRQIWRGFEAHERQGDRPNFEVPQELARAWGL
ncbi:MAG TPA: oxygenase MpaB family protein [Acidimicrobiales bacterium]|jgi:hypothetical protein|nr:oxygenase MpaB family protein [Acidimicrobiales bacterium]